MKSKPVNQLADSRDELLHALDDQLLPWSRGTGSSLILAQLPWREYSGAIVNPQPSPLLKVSSQARAGSLTEWAREGMVASHLPSLLCVLEGPIQRCLGVTTRMARENSMIQPGVGRYIIQLPKTSFLITPAMVPLDDGTKPHWFDGKRPLPDSKLFWIHPNYSGVTLHICSTQGGVHRNHGGVFLKDTHILPLCEFLIDDLQTSVKDALPSTRDYLSVILARIHQSLSRERSHHFKTMIGSFTDVQDGDFNIPVENVVNRARQFINAHYLRKLSNEIIAAHCYISASHLIRLFRQEMGMTPMAYVEKRRMETAFVLLRETRMSIFEISNYLSYKHPDIFRRAFLRHNPDTPHAFRSKSARTVNSTTLDKRKLKK